MAVRKLRGRYAVEFELRGHRVFRRLPTGATKAQAEALELKHRRELIDTAVVGNPPSISLDAAMAEWAKTRREGDKEIASKIRLVRAGLEKLQLTSAPLTDVQRISAELVDLWRGLAPGTINRRLCAIKATCKWAWKVKRWTPHNLSPHVEILRGEEARERVIPAAQIDALIKKAKGAEAKAFIALGAYGMLRQGEVMKLTPKDVANGWVRAQSKNGPVRLVDAVPQLKPHLKAIPLTLHKRTLYARFEAARDALKIPDLTYHDLRRSGATILLNRKVDLAVISEILGHRDIETTRKIYALVQKDTIRKAMRKGFKPIKIPTRKGGPGGI